MTDHVVLKRWILNGEIVPPMSWFGGSKPDIKCPKGHIGSLANHRILADGTVLPSIVCHDRTCGWHVWGRLEGWPVGKQVKE